jgi:hypothetical protein
MSPAKQRAAIYTRTNESMTEFDQTTCTRTLAGLDCTLVTVCSDRPRSHEEFRLLRDMVEVGALDLVVTPALHTLVHWSEAQTLVHDWLDRGIRIIAGTTDLQAERTRLTASFRGGEAAFDLLLLSLAHYGSSRTAAFELALGEAADRIAASV